MGYATLSRSRTYIMVPRDVPPENFVTVQETRKVERVGLARCLLPPCLVVGCLLLLASILAAVGFLLSIKTYEANTETGKTLWSNRQQGDEAIYCGEGEWGSLKCHPCLCSKIGSLSKACHRGSGQCTCKEGHSGHKCDICPQGAAEQGGRCPNTTSSTGRGCGAVSPCLGPGSSCEEHDNTFTCYCAKGRTGKFCEKVIALADLVVAGFTGTSLVVVRSPSSPNPGVSISLEVKPAALNGVLISSSQFTLSLETGVPVLRSGDRQLLSAHRPLRPHKWHSIRLSTYRGDARLSVQGQVVTGSGLVGELSALELGRNFDGCMRGLAIGHQPVSLVSPAEPLVQHSQGLEECPCREGSCKDQGKRPCKEGACQLQGDQGKGEEEEQSRRRKPQEQGVENDNSDLLVRVRYRGETRLLRPRGGKLELDSLQDTLLPESL